MKPMTLTPIGILRADANGFRAEVDEIFRAGLEGLESFGWTQLIWWAHQSERTGTAELVCPHPYQGGPDRLGVFATRSPCRPNPIGLSTAPITGLDLRRGHVHLAWMDALDGTPLLDLKPYHPSADRVEKPSVPEWCRRWPASVEASASFDWETVFPG